jgi:O-antigen/teichoic acid export membrane protein
VPPVADFLVKILYGKAWAEEPGLVPIVQWYCWLVFLLALNGVTEAYFYAKAGEEDLQRASWFSVLIAIAQTSCILFYRSFGPVSLLVGNALGFILRIFFSWKLNLRFLFDADKWIAFSAVALAGVAIRVIGSIKDKSLLGTPDVSSLMNMVHAEADNLFNVRLFYQAVVCVLASGFVIPIIVQDKTKSA